MAEAAVKSGGIAVSDEVEDIEQGEEPGAG